MIFCNFTATLELTEDNMNSPKFTKEKFVDFFEVIYTWTDNATNIDLSLGYFEWINGRWVAHAGQIVWYCIGKFVLYKLGRDSR